MARVLDGGTSPESGTDVPELASSSGSSPLPCNGRTKCICQDYYDPEFLERLHEHANVSFRWRTFWKELVYHTFFPLTLPLIFLWEGGHRGILNRQFWGSPMLTLSQWAIATAFFLLNGLTYFYFSPDIFFVDFLWVVRCLILATKYGFTSDREMNLMKLNVLPLAAHMDRTLLLAWTNPIPLRVLKRQLLLAAVRKNALRCNSALRLVPGASDKTVHQIMQQLTDSTKCSKTNHQSEVRLSSWDSLDRAIGFDEKSQLCAKCLKETGYNKSFETRWLDLCMSDIFNDPGLIVPTEAILAEHVSTSRSDHEDERACPALDLPALLLAAYILQRASNLLPSKMFLHQLFICPWRLYYCSVFVGIIHAIIPFATRALVGEPSTFGGTHWYNYVVSVSSFIVNYTSMSASVNFMLGGLADFRRRYFVARLLNTLLKDGCCGEETGLPSESRKHLAANKSVKKKSPYHLGLAVNFTDPRSILGWWAVRCLVQDFGLVFYMRVKYYATYFALYCGFLMAFLVVKLFETTARSASYILAVVVFDLLVFIGLLCLVVSPGGDTNKMNVEHGATIYRIKMSISTKLDQCGEELKFEERRSMKLAIEVLESMSEAIYWDNCINQITFLGFTASVEILGVLIGAGSTAVGIAAQQLTATIKA